MGVGGADGTGVGVGRGVGDGEGVTFIRGVSVGAGRDTVTFDVPFTVPFAAFSVVVPEAIAMKKPVVLIVPTVVLLFVHVQSKTISSIS